jgi:hypothetical protein
VKKVIVMKAKMKNYIDGVKKMSEEEKKIVDESRKNYCFV